MSYFIIKSSEDGTYIDELTSQELINRLNENYYGETEFLTTVKDNDPNYWGNGMMIIKGEAITPGPKKVVKEYELD